MGSGRNKEVGRARAEAGVEGSSLQDGVWVCFVALSCSAAVLASLKARKDA
jgi:hypothetical protein